jgi:Domain of unknown function (DUF4160)
VRPSNKELKLTSLARSELRSLTPVLGRHVRGLARRRKLRRMPVISTFFGIVIRMFYQEHRPPHFHAEYQGQQATFDFDGRAVAGDIRSAVAKRLIREWAAQHVPSLRRTG